MQLLSEECQWVTSETCCLVSLQSIISTKFILFSWPLLLMFHIESHRMLWILTLAFLPDLFLPVVSIALHLYTSCFAALTSPCGAAAQTSFLGFYSPHRCQVNSLKQHFSSCLSSSAHLLT